MKNNDYCVATENIHERETLPEIPIAKKNSEKKNEQRKEVHGQEV